ncbi:hypothetical protein GQ44DRAFT_799070 [Phaeosphaeriaceae sp. PMI808]|nr:hypothetical protein GQ44DRAFT_799070 [Phaeosphaeriaceae sp. PMI808]
MLTISDQSVLDEVEKAEAENPSPRKIIDNVHTIYSSYKLGLPKDSLWGQPVLCDFGEARIGDYHKGLIQPELCRAQSVGIWSVAALVWGLFENKHLFTAGDKSQGTSATDHVAEMIAYLGLPPLEYVQRSKVTKNVFDEQGKWKGAGGRVIPQLSLGESVTTLHGENKEHFLHFTRSML